MLSPELLVSTRHQLSAIQEEVEKILGGEFPYEHSRDALLALKARFSDCEDQLRLAESSSDSSLVETTCLTAAKEMSSSIQLVGFLLRSTNVRNAFEAWGPLLRLARRLLRRDTKLVISSEWEVSPFTFVGLPAIPDFVLIGLPAPESSNPFVLGVAGHELGHNLWAQYKLEQTYQLPIKKYLINEIKGRWADFCKLTNLSVDPSKLETDIFALREWRPTLQWALRQCEECFCDCVGARIFGGSYVCAFEYLLGPPDSAARSALYPTNFDRAQTIADAIKVYHMRQISTSFVNSFKAFSPTGLLARKAFLLKIADDARTSVTKDLIAEAEKLVSGAGISKPSDDQIEKCQKRFKYLSPVEGISEISELLIAAWISLKTDSFYSNFEHEKRKRHLISQLVWKSLEVFEIEQRLRVS